MKRLAQPVCLAAALLLVAPALQAQTGTRSVKPVPQKPAPPTTVGMPSPSGLPPATPFPAGLPSPSPFPAGMPPVAIPNLPSPGTPPPGSTPTPPDDGSVVPPPPVPGPGGGSVPRSAAGPGPHTVVQLAQSFLLADTNRDGELSRAEAQGLAILPMSFEEMDTNRDGVISRFEYQDATR